MKFSVLQRNLSGRRKAVAWLPEVLGFRAVGGKQEQMESSSAAKPWIHYTAASDQLPLNAKAQKAHLLAEVLETKPLRTTYATSGDLRKVGFFTVIDKTSLADSIQWHTAIPSVPLLGLCRLPQVDPTQVQLQETVKKPACSFPCAW